jgi:CIC family chloride channel protein
LGLYSLLGILPPGWWRWFTTILYKVEDLFDAWIKFPDYLKTPIMGAGAGRHWAFCLPSGAGSGYEGMELALHGKVAWWLLFVIMGIKILATSADHRRRHERRHLRAQPVYRGHAGRGIRPVGAQRILPEITAGAGAYALVAMAAVVAGTTHGPLAAFLILFEMTNTYTIILPLDDQLALSPPWWPAGAR